jgi:hypothetical protein
MSEPKKYYNNNKNSEKLREKTSNPTMFVKLIFL